MFRLLQKTGRDQDDMFPAVRFELCGRPWNALNELHSLS